MFDIFDTHPELLVAMSEKKDGNLTLGDTDEEIMQKNRSKFLERIGIESKNVVSADLVHGNNVQVVLRRDRAAIIPETDGLLTNEQDVYVSITAADCLPVFFYDLRKNVAGLAHAGWRGLAKSILPNIVDTMAREFGSSPEDIIVGIGPGIGDCHYDVKEDVAKQFEDFPSAIRNAGKKQFLDLKKIASFQLRDVGILKKNIEIHPACTYCKKSTYFSYRRTKPEPIQAMMAVIGMRQGI